MHWRLLKDLTYVKQDKSLRKKKTSLFITIKDDDLSPHASHYDAPKSLSINQKGDCTQFETELLVGVEWVSSLSCHNHKIQPWKPAAPTHAIKWAGCLRRRVDQIDFEAEKKQKKVLLEVCSLVLAVGCKTKR